MIYKDYFTQSNYKDVWSTLKNYYKEPADLEKIYKVLFYTIRSLPVDEEHSATPLKIVYDFEDMIHVEGAPDPIEWLIGREVIFRNEIHFEGEPEDETPYKKPTVPEMAAHLLYWSTLYAFKTQSRHHKDFQQYIEALEKDSVMNDSEDSGKLLSWKRKNAYYWKETVAYDSAISWHYILDILRKRIEYHIGYHRYADRFVRTKHYISRMVLSTRLLEIAASDYNKEEGVFVNTRNASRFVGTIFTKYDIIPLTEKYSDKTYIESELRRQKAYKILWKFLDHNLTHWWD